MEARELSGFHIDRRIRWSKPHWVPGAPPIVTVTDPITMITHKKNGNVIVRHGKNNRQAEFRKQFPVGLVEEGS